MSVSRARILAWTVPIVLLGFALRLYRLGDQNVWWDEGLAVWAARQSLAAAARWTAADVHPPLYFWLLHVWRGLSGDGEFGLRYLSALIGTLTLPATFILGRRLAGSPVGLLAMLLVAVSRFAITWSQEMRMYGLAALWAALTLWAAARVWARPDRRAWAAYVLFATAGLYTLYLFAAVLVVVNLVWLGWVGWRRRQAVVWWRWVAAQIGVLILATPWLAYALGRIPTWSAATPVDPWLFVRVYWTALAVGASAHIERYALVTLPVLVILAAGTVVLVYRTRLRSRAGRHLALLWLGLGLPGVVVYLVSLPKDVFFYSPPLAPRYFLIFVTAYVVLLAWAALTLAAGRPWPTVALGGILLFVAGFGLADYYPDRALTDDYRSAARTLQVYRRPTDAVLLVTDRDWPIFAYHYADAWQGLPHAWRLTPEQTAAFLAPLWEASEGIWLVLTPYAAMSDPDGLLADWLHGRARAVVEHRFPETTLRFYARTPVRAAVVHDPNPGVRPQIAQVIPVTDGLTLTGYDLPLSTARPGDLLHLFLYWQADRPTRVTLALRQDNTDLWQQPLVVSAGLHRQQVDIPIPPTARPGRAPLELRGPDGPRILTTLTLHPRRGPTTAPPAAAPAHSLDVAFGEGIRLVGYDLDRAQLRPGEALALTLYWQAQGTISGRYKVFTHLLGDRYNAESGNFLWGQQDNEPVRGERPTTTWQPGEVIADPYRIGLHPQAPPGVYRLEIGLYHPTTGERLPRLDEQGRPVADHLILTTVVVVGSK
jgi:4-amino-4-deoxy-L-arabinose transferase-like glycosyltransferase